MSPYHQARNELQLLPARHDVLTFCPFATVMVSVTPLSACAAGTVLLATCFASFLAPIDAAKSPLLIASLLYAALQECHTCNCGELEAKYCDFSVSKSYLMSHYSWQLLAASAETSHLWRQKWALKLTEQCVHHASKLLCWRYLIIVFTARCRGDHIAEVEEAQTAENICDRAAQRTETPVIHLYSKHMLIS